MRKFWVRYAHILMLATMPFRVTRQILRDNKITLDTPPIKLLHGQVSVPLETGTLKENKKELGLDSADEQRLV